MIYTVISLHVEHIPHNNMSHLAVNSYEFYWDGQEWVLVNKVTSKD